MYVISCYIAYPDGDREANDQVGDVAAYDVPVKEAGMYVISCYIAYLIICLTVTVWVARTLYNNGRVFLVDAFHGDSALADSVNHLLVVGFYLINLGYVSMALTTTQQVASLRQTFE